MSNSYPERKKIISIKRLDDIHQKQAEEEHAHTEDNEFILQMAIDQLKQQIKNLENQKEKVLAELKTAIETERQSWEEQKQFEKKEAQDMGYKIGYDAGYEEVFQQHENLLNEANAIVDLSKEEYEKTIEKHENTILHLATLSAQKILDKQLSDDQGNFLDIVKKAIEDLKDSSYVSIYVHPDYYQHLMKQKEELEQTLHDENVLSIYVEKSLNKNDCIIKHPYGQIDIGIDSQLQQIKKALAEKVAER